MEISGIIIEIHGKKYEINLEQAKKLHQELGKLFGAKDTTYVPYPVYPYYQPYTYETPTVDPLITYCSTSSNQLTISLDDGVCTYE